MLKKSLHFLKRFILLPIFFSLLISLLSCIHHKEGYLAFLDAPAEYDASLIINEEVSATFILIKEERGENREAGFRLRFTSPEILCGAEISYIGDEGTLTYNGIVLDGYKLAEAWKKIFELFSPDGEVSEVKAKDGKSYITVSDKSGKETVYVLERDGTLCRIESDITVEIKSIRDYKEGGNE